MENTAEKKYDIDSLRAVMEDLLGENGCEWDKAQSHESLKKYLIEECYEVIDAIDKKDSTNLCEELGDLLFQIVFHSCLAQKEGLFSFDDVTEGITKKMIQRHPHVFAGEHRKDGDDINKKWESIKKQEKGYKSNMEIIKSVPRSLPALMRSVKTFSKAESVGVYEPDYAELSAENAVLSENIKSLINSNNMERIEIIGNFLLNLSKISHFLQINAEFSLTNALETYINRIEDIENAKTADGGIKEDTDSKAATVKTKK